MTNFKCESCTYDLSKEPSIDCQSLEHWKSLALNLQNKIEFKDEDRDKFDVAEWLLNYNKVKSYTCHGCQRHYDLPTHINHFTCVCGHGCRLRHVGGINPDQEVIDAAIKYFGNERSAQLAWIAEIVVGEHCLYYTADEIRNMIRQEMARWSLGKNGWVKVK